MRFSQLCKFFVFFVAQSLGINRVYANTERCTTLATLDFFYLQDDTLSFSPYVTLVRNELPKLFYALETEYPESRFGLSLFSDSARPLGARKTAYCSKRIFALTPSYSVINNYLNTEFQPQQGDVERSEDALSAMSVAALDDSIGWADTTINSWTRRFTVHVILVVTDALFQYTAPAIPKLAAAPGSPCVGHAPRSGSTFSVNYKCTDDDYVTLEAAKSALASREVVPVIVTVPDAVEGWKILLEYLGQGGAVLELSTALSNNGTAFVEALANNIKEVVCDVGRTTTLVPHYLVAGSPLFAIAVASGGAAATFVLVYAAWKYFSRRQQPSTLPVDQLDEETEALQASTDNKDDAEPGQPAEPIEVMSLAEENGGYV